LYRRVQAALGVETFFQGDIPRRMLSADNKIQPDRGWPQFDRLQCRFTKKQQKTKDNRADNAVGPCSNEWHELPPTVK
jgi:hypothetical protein